MDDLTPAPPEPAVAPSPFAAVRVRGWLAWLALAGVTALALVLAVNMTRRSSLVALFLPLVLVSFHGTRLLWMRATFARLGISWRRLMGPLPSFAQLGETV